MKCRLLNNSLAAAALLFAVSACEKQREPIDAYKVTVDYKNTSQYAVTSDVSVNPKDSIFFDFTITSAEEMTYVEIQKNGVRIDTFNVKGSPTTFSATKGYRADSIPGDYTYRVLARDKQATFLGDGNKVLKVTVNADFDFWSYRILAVPDTVAKMNKCYMSTTDGSIYSFSEGAANSAKIDFGYYYDTTGTGTSSTADDLKHTFYALNVSQPQLSFYDISSWTKNATVFKKMPSSVNFVSNLTSGGSINTFIKNNMTSGTSSKVTAVNTSSGNNVIGFKTAAGKYGAILLRYSNRDSPANGTTVEVDVKVQK